MLSAGTYLAKVTGLITSETKDQQPQMAVEIEVTHLASGASWEPINPERRSMYWHFSDGAMPYTTKKLQAIGFNGDFDNPDCGDAAKIQGVAVICRHESYEGQAKEKWELANWGSNAQQASASALAIAKAKWRAACGGSAPKPTPAKPATPPAKPVTAPPPAPKAKPSAPAPAPAAGANAGTATRDQAWATILGANDGDAAKAGAAFTAAVEEYSKTTGKDETEFEPGDWFAVGERGKLPF